MTNKFLFMKLRGFAKLQNGVAAVEFAIVLIPLLLIVAGLVEFGRTFWYYDALAKATRDGARLMSMANKDVIADTKDDVEDLVVNAAGINGAKVSPALTSDNVLVQCLNASYVSQGCVNGTAPFHVSVRIVDFSVAIGDWIPFISTSGNGITTFNDINISPSTTMRYMCTGVGSC